MGPDSPSSSGPVTVSAQLQNARFLLQFLKAIQLREKGDVTIAISDNGLKLTTEDSKTYQANAYVQKELFRTFDLKGGPGPAGGDRGEPETCFRLRGGTLVDCLGLFGHQPGAAPVMCLKYSEGDPLRLWLEDGGVVTEVRARTRAADRLLDFGFNNADIKAKVILQAEHLKEVLSDLDLSGSDGVDHVEVSVDGPRRELRFGTSGASVDLDVSIPGDSPVVTHFSSSSVDGGGGGTVVGGRYKCDFFRVALRPLAIAEKVSVRVDDRRVLCLQYMVGVEDRKSFLEFLCLPDDDDVDLD